jgi:hypothetical protein
MAPAAESEKRARIKAYFMPRPTWPFWATAIGVIAVPIGFTAHVVWLWLAGIAVAAGAIYVLVAKPGIATDAEVDACIHADRARVPQRAVQRLGIDPDSFVAEPVIFSYGLGFAAGGNGFKASRRGDDRLRRTTPIGVTVVDMTRNQLLIYQCGIDLTTGNFINDSTRELFWQDVVEVRTATETRTLSIADLPQRERALLVEDGWHVMNDVIQYDGEMSVNISMTSGHSNKLAFWDGRQAGDDAFGGDTENDRALGRLRFVVRDMKERAHHGRP